MGRAREDRSGQVAATAPFAYGTCGSRQTRNQQVTSAQFALFVPAHTCWGEQPRDVRGTGKSLRRRYRHRFRTTRKNVKFIWITPSIRGRPSEGAALRTDIGTSTKHANTWEYWVFQKEPSLNHNGLMHVVLVTLDSLGPSVYTIFGLVLIFGSSLIRRLAFEPTPQVSDAGRRDGVEVRIRSKKVVPINRALRVAQRAPFPDWRVGNFP